MSESKEAHPYRTLAEVVQSVRDHTAPASVRGDLLDYIRELRELIDQGLPGVGRDVVASIIKDLAETRDDLVRRYAAIDKLLTWFSSGVGTAGGVASIAAVASRSGLVVTVALIVLTIAIVLMARVILVQIEPWTLVIREIEGAIVDLRKQAHDLPATAAVEREKMWEEMATLTRRLEAHEQRVASEQQDPPTGVRVTENPAAGKVSSDEEIPPRENERRGAR
ncbi:MAG: hypothetical protein EPO40_19690 [Myxococcaceae bacterium]|nr:MAG: hypothetical protein EPO40_19690 [Myxococcaceae bacterium]